jgi:hypothetical protein
VSELGEKTDV